MISLYSTFRSFEHPRYSKIQHDAIQSWLALVPRPQIIILGDDSGTRKVCKKYGIKHVPEVAASKARTPYVDDFIRVAEKHAQHETMLLCSGDICIAQNTIDAAEAIRNHLKEFCVCARKKHVEIESGKIQKEIRWATWQAGDYWLHSKGLFDKMPKFLIGRHKNEKWMFRHCCNKNALVDGSPAITVYHQFHPHQFKPAHKEVEYNEKLYLENYFEVDKWKDTPWYKNKCRDIGFNFANWILQEDLTLVENTTPQRAGFK
jgi:hypothetical protein